MRSSTCAIFLVLCCLLLKNVQGGKKKNNAEESENDNKIGNHVKQFDKTEKQKLNSHDKGTNSIKNKVIKNNGKEGKNDNKNKNTDNSSEETTEIQEFQKNKTPKIKQNKDPDEKVFFTKVKKANHVIKHYRKVKIDQDSEDDNSESEEDFKKQEKQNSEKFNKKVKGSSKRNNQNKDDFTDHKQKICKKSKNGEGCNDSDENNSDHQQYSEEEDEKSFQPTIKYSIKFKHEKEKNKAAKKENLSILRLHRKRGKNKDDDDLSSEEDDAPFQKKKIFAHTEDD